MTALLPIAIVALAATALVVLELLKTFGRDVLEALRNRWAWLLIGVNVLTAGVVYAIVRGLFRTEDDLGTAIIVGLSFPLLLRSRFTLFRSVGPKDDNGQLSTISLKIDEAYTALQNLCWESVDGSLADRRATQAERLAEQVSMRELVDSIEHHIDARRLEANKVRDRERLKTILQIADERKRKYPLALMLIEINPSQAARLLRRKR